jgi:hypothetical protein
MRTSIAIALSMMMVPVLLPGTSGAAEPASSEWARYTEDGKLIKPENYREWVTIGTGLNMAYGPPAQQASTSPPYTNVLVSPAAYRAFLQTGGWADKTVFILEIRASVPVNAVKNGNNGYFQGDVVGMEAEVKDSKFANGWAFFNIGRTGTTGQMLPTTASCYSCHAKNAAVENTFVQFYPVLRDVAKEKGTFKTVAERF